MRVVYTYHSMQREHHYDGRYDSNIDYSPQEQSQSHPALVLEAWLLGSMVYARIYIGGISKYFPYISKACIQVCVWVHTHLGVCSATQCTAFPREEEKDSSIIRLG